MIRHVSVCVAILAFVSLLYVGLAHAQDDVASVPHSDENRGEDDQPLALDPAAEAIVNDVWTQPGDIPHFEVRHEGKAFALPLEHTHVAAEIVGSVAYVEVRQTYSNPLPDPIETTYVFPLPENSAVNDMEITVADRVIRAEIKTRQDAQAIFDKARENGNTAALLEQERPNIFTQSVTNLPPGESIDVVVRYVQDLAYDNGEYEFVFPMVVGPRYIPGSRAVGRSGEGWSPDTDQVPDASRITPPIVGGGMRTGHDISIELTVDAGLPINGFAVPTHEIAAEQLADGTLALMLAEAESLPNRDFVLRYAVGGDMPEATILTQRGDNGGHFTFILQPPDLDVDALVGDREFVFVVDISGSMSGKPLAMVKDAMSQSLRSLRPGDTFNVITFASNESMLWKEAHPANNTNIRVATEFIDGLVAGGGTQMTNAVDAAFAMAGPAGRNRYVFFMTDGFVGNEDAILASAQAYTEQFPSIRKDARARVFGFGVGSSPNRHLLDGLSKAGDGTTVYASNREDPSRAVNAFFNLVDHPVITDIEVDWGALKPRSVHPEKLPDLFASRPMVLHGKFKGKGKTEITVRGKVDGDEVEISIPIDIPRGDHGEDVHETLWARAHVADLSRTLWDGHDDKTVDKITQTGLDYRLVTAFTSLVAVDYERTTKGKLKKIVQPVDAPEDVDLDMAAPPEAQRMALEGLPGIAPEQLAISGKSGGFGGGSGSGLGGGSGSGFGVGGLGTSGAGTGGGGANGNVSNKSSRPKPKLKMATPTVSGSLDKAIIRKVFSRKRTQYKACYESALMGNPKLSGKIVLKLTINMDGTLASLEIKNDSVGDDDMAACVMKISNTLLFPAQDGGIIVVSYPLVFAPNE